MPQYVRVKGHPIEHGHKAYRDEYYFEAIQTIHSWLECKLRELLLLQRTRLNKGLESWPRAWDISNEFALNQAARTLFLLGAINESELQRISVFNKVRNNIVHKLFWDPYDERWKGVPKNEFRKAFQSGVKLCNEIEFKSGEYVGSTM